LSGRLHDQVESHSHDSVNQVISSTPTNKIQA